MGLWEFLKKLIVSDKADTNLTQAVADWRNATAPQKTIPTIFDERLDRLDEDGDLPFGWLTQNKEFTDKINREYSYFLHLWIDASKKSPRELYAALKSFVLFLEDAEKLCVSKGECFEFWWYETIASKEYIAQRKKELQELTDNLNERQAIYEALKNIDVKIITLLKENDGILQSDFIKLFDEPFQGAVRNTLYRMSKSGELERTKQGNSYLLHYNL